MFFLSKPKIPFILFGKILSNIEQDSQASMYKTIYFIQILIIKYSCEFSSIKIHFTFLYLLFTYISWMVWFKILACNFYQKLFNLKSYKFIFSILVVYCLSIRKWYKPRCSAEKNISFLIIYFSSIKKQTTLLTDH